MSEASMCFSGSEADSTTSHSASVTCGTALAVLAPACSQPAKCTCHTTWVTAAWHSSSLEKHPGAEEMELKILKCHKQECPSSGRVSAHCSVIPRSGLCRDSGTWRPFRAAASSAMWQLLRALQPCHSLPLLLLMVQGTHLCRAAGRVTQSDSTAASCFLSSRHLPHKSLLFLLACDHCQALKHWHCPAPVKYCHPHQP